MVNLKFLKFIKAFITKPQQVGSVIPSSKFLAQEILKNIDFSTTKLVIEYGPGTGVFTKFLLGTSANSKTQVRLIEFNPDFVEFLNQRFPSNQHNIVIKMDRASNVKNILTSPDEKVDVVISSLPFTFFPWDETEATIRETYGVLAEGGIFRTYLYLHTLPLPKIKRLLKLLKDVFGQVNSWVCIANFPPALVIECRKTRHQETNPIPKNDIANRQSSPTT